MLPQSVVVLLTAIEKKTQNIHLTTIVCLHTTLLDVNWRESCHTMELTNIAWHIYIVCCQLNFTTAAVKSGIYNYCKSDITGRGLFLNYLVLHFSVLHFLTSPSQQNALTLSIQWLVWLLPIDAACVPILSAILSVVSVTPIAFCLSMTSVLGHRTVLLSRQSGQANPCSVLSWTSIIIYQGSQCDFWYSWLGLLHVHCAPCSIKSGFWTPLFSFYRPNFSKCWSVVIKKLYHCVRYEFFLRLQCLYSRCGHATRPNSETSTSYE